MLFHNTSGLKPVGSILILLVVQSYCAESKAARGTMWTQNIFCQWQNRHYELRWRINQSLFLAVGKALRVHSTHSRSTWGPRASQRWNYNSSVMPVLKGLSLPWVTPHEEDVILTGHYQLCKLKTWKTPSSKCIIKNWGNMVCLETLWQACIVFNFPALISILENQEWGKRVWVFFLLWFFLVFFLFGWGLFGFFWFFVWLVSLLDITVFWMQKFKKYGK